LAQLLLTTDSHMRAMFMLLLLLGSHRAFAQSEPQAAPVPSTNPSNWRQSGDTIDLGEWPGPGLDELRSAKPCTLDDPPQVIGEAVRCRPPVLPSKIQFGISASWLLGLGIDSPDRNDALRGAHGMAVDADIWLARNFSVGARAALAGTKTVSAAGADSPWGKSLTVGAQLRVRHFLDEVERDAVSVTAGAGFSLRNAALGDNAWAARVAVARELGSYVNDRTALTLALELSYEHSIDAEQRRTIMFGLRGGVEHGIVEPHNLGSRAGRPWIRYITGGEFRASSSLGFGITLGQRLTDHVAWRNTALFTFGHGGGGLRGNDGAIWAIETGPRWRSSNDDFGIYVDVQAGAGVIGGAANASRYALAEGEFGLDIGIGCQTRINFGGRVQVRLDDPGFNTAFFIIRAEAGPGYAQRGCSSTPLVH
jgi:hypothetical protein